MDKYLKQNQIEFSKQAEMILKSERFNDKKILEDMLNFCNLKGDEVVLDVACGPGIVSTAFAQNVKQVYSLDITDKMVEICNNLVINNINAVQGSAENLPFEDQKFDIVVNRLAIHHFHDPSKVLKEMKRVLKVDGMIIIADIFSSDDKEKAKLHNSLEYLRDPSHTKMLSLKEFEDLFEENNLEIIKSKTFEQDCDLEQWLKITNTEERNSAVECVINKLVEANFDAGIDLRKTENEKIEFTHSWVLYRLGVKK